MGIEWPIILSVLNLLMLKLKNSGLNLLEGQVWLHSVSTCTSNYITTSRLALSITMPASRQLQCQGKLIEPRNCFQSESLHWPFRTNSPAFIVLSVNLVVCIREETAVVDWEERLRKLMLIICHARFSGEFSCPRFSLRVWISKLWWFATDSNYVGVWIRPL